MDGEVKRTLVVFQSDGSVPDTSMYWNKLRGFRKSPGMFCFHCSQILVKVDM